ncbi:conserved hypothetical protein [Leishmania mexicana MHOM/GT/2001/U1103]|uniref:DNA polymerase alpha subunit B n=1 Tax=Leishmania mexicana (strain MHOM/GT/2001/U1103) TaxID=929439 RepID=E9B2U8_LEIMU|nr:conserved hypothetical protein [Leishmania mexicana MHOM/GT/2001/U1103]CBZ29562.1 conserved hypothetical protein [Leishmania mexicana MHOM/GT/2001/U1103]
MQVEGNWKAAANLNLLLGLEHPPARLEKPLLTPQQRSAGSSALVTVEARNTANFRSSSYCGLQDKSAPTIRRHVIDFYKEMLYRVPLWRGLVKTQEEGTCRGTVVETELEDDDDADGMVPLAGGAPVASGGPLFRAVGILTQVQDPSAVSAATQQAPWEFYVVRDMDDDECYIRALQAMAQADRTTGAFFSLLQDASHAGFCARTSGRLEGSTARPSTGMAATSAIGEAGEETPGTAAEADEEAAAGDGTRLSLYTRQASWFTGLHPGMAVGIIGDPFQRSARGVLTGVLVREFVLPSRPTLPWRVDRPLLSATVTSTSGAGALADVSGAGVRIHFCSGPFPRRDVSGLLRTVTSQALHRGADVLIIGGPFILPFASEFERELLPSLGATFNEVMESFVDTLEETLKNYYSTRPLLTHMKVLLVSHRGDVTQIPVLPTTMYAIADTDDILIRSNPCRLSVNGVHVSVCNEDVVGGMRERMVERWPTAEGSLRRVVEALVNGRLYVPLYSLPVTTADLKHLPHLRMDYVPSQNELLEIKPAAAALTSNTTAKGGRHGDADRGDATTSTSSASSSRGWEAVFSVAEQPSTDVAEWLKHKVKRVKLEDAAGDGEEGDAATTPRDPVTASTPTASSKTECLPHIMFLPSTRPQFATVTHQSEEVDGADIDSADSASGVLVVNQEVWSTRSSPKFELRVAEVTIPNTDVVLRRGATSRNGVACGVLHIYSA